MRFSHGAERFADAAALTAHLVALGFDQVDAQSDPLKRRIVPCGAPSADKA